MLEKKYRDPKEALRFKVAILRKYWTGNFEDDSRVLQTVGGRKKNRTRKKKKTKLKKTLRI